MRILLIILLCVLAHDMSAQRCTVTHVTGSVYYRGNLLRVKDKVDRTDSLWASGPDAEVGLLDPVNGRQLLQFKAGKRVRSRSNPRSTELYALTIQEYLSAYTTVKLLTHKGTFDLIDFFADTTGLGEPLPVLMIPGQGLPLTSNQLTFHPSDEILLCYLHGKDTVSLPLHKTADSVFLDHLPEGHYQAFLKFRYTFQGQQKSFVAPNRLKVTVISQNQVKNIVCAFKANLDSFYQGDTEKMQKDIYAELQYYYGRFYEPAIEQLITCSCL